MQICTPPDKLRYCATQATVKNDEKKFKVCIEFQGIALYNVKKIVCAIKLLFSLKATRPMSSAKIGKEELLSKLAEWNIETETVEHSQV